MTAALLIDTENLFYDYGLWLSEDRFGYRKHLCAPGLDAAVVVEVDRDAVRTAAVRALECCISWSEHITQRQVAVRSYGKTVDWGVRSVGPAFNRLSVKHENVQRGKNKADLALKADFERNRAEVDTFVFGGEDEMLRTSVHEFVHVEEHELRFAFIVPERNFGALAKHSLTPALNNAKIAILVESERFVPGLPDLIGQTTRGDRYYAALCEVVVPTAAAARADPDTEATRAPQPPMEPAPPAAPAPPAPPGLALTNPWELIAVKLMARDLMHRPAVDAMLDPTWRDTLRSALQRRSPDLSDMADLLADRLHRTFMHYPTAGEHLQVRNEPGTRAAPGSGWPVQLAAAALLHEIVDEVPDRNEKHPGLAFAYRRARQWLGQPVS